MRNLFKALTVSTAFVGAVGAQENTLADNIISRHEIQAWQLFENAEGQPITKDDRFAFDVQTTDGKNICGNTTSAYADGVTVRGLDKNIFLLPDGSPGTCAEVIKGVGGVNPVWYTTPTDIPVHQGN
jgi:hypothetical protein